MRNTMKRSAAALLVLAMVVMLLCLPSLADSGSSNEYGIEEYVALGDSIAQGKNLMTDGSGGYFGCFDVGYPSLLAERLQILDPSVSHHTYLRKDLGIRGKFYSLEQPQFHPWSAVGFRTTELLHQLDADCAVPEDSFTDHWLKERMAEMAALRPDLLRQLRSADLITLEVGANDILVDPLFTTLWEMVDEQDGTLTQGELEDILLSKLGMGSGDIPEDVDADALLKTFLERIIPRIGKGYSVFLKNYPDLVRRLREISPDAQIVLLGVPNVLHELSLTNDALPVSLGEILDATIAPMDLVIAGVATRYGCTYVNIADVSLDGDNHPTMEGYRSMADRIEARLRARTNFKDVATLSSENRLAVRWGEISRDFAGTSDTRFSPYTAVTRAQFVQAVYNMAGTPEPESSASFRDVSAKADYAKAVAWAAENGIVAGTSKNYFSPNLALTKKQAVTILYKYDLLRAENGLGTAGNYSDALTWAADQGITKGFSNVAMKTATLCTRAQAVLFLYRYAR